MGIVCVLCLVLWLCSEEIEKAVQLDLRRMNSSRETDQEVNYASLSLHPSIPDNCCNTVYR
jgi:hypothetical protein